MEVPRELMAAELLLVCIPSRIKIHHRSTAERIWDPPPHDGSKMVSHFPPLVEEKRTHLHSVSTSFGSPLHCLLCRCSLGAVSDKHNEHLNKRIPLCQPLHLGHDLFLSLCRLDVDHEDVLPSLSTNEAKLHM